MRKFWLTPLLGVVAMSSAAAQTVVTAPPAAQPGKAAAQSDPNRKICEVQEEIGSRLQQRKVCATAQQWRDLRQQTKDQIQDIQQKQSGKAGGG